MFPYNIKYIIAVKLCVCNAKIQDSATDNDEVKPTILNKREIDIFCTIKSLLYLLSKFTISTKTR